jgi:hypothetical protein
MTYVALVGVTLIIVRGHGAAFVAFRKLWPSLLECTQCTGAWVGIAAGASGVAAMGHGRPLDALLVGGAVSVLTLLTDAVLVKLLGDPHDEE